MLDGLFGRGFAARCKSSIKLITRRIDVIRRKRKATEKFLKKDIADLLVNGHDINAYGRVVKQADRLVVELTVSSCYDFIEQSCEFVLKHLLVMQKLSGCPEECREAVSSLMLAAARFSDLPELRDLRQIFQERYGNSVECYVNQEFAANLNLRSSTLEKKVSLMQEIALEFSIKWDSKALEQRMSKPSVFAQDHKICKTNSLTHNNEPSHGNDGALKGVKYDVLLERSPAHPSNEAIVSRRDDDDLRSRSKPPKYRLKLQNGRDEVIPKSDGHDHERQEITAKESDRRHWNEGGMLKPTGQGGSSQDIRAEQFEYGSSWGNRTPHKDETPMVNTYNNSAIPPPYVKSNSKRKNRKFGANVDFSQEGDGTIPTRPSLHDKPDAAITTSERTHLGLEKPSVHELATEVPVFKLKSSRRKQSKSRSSQYDASAEDTSIVTRKLRSRRRDDTRRGLQILFDDEQYQNHEEERIMDKLLLHYSKKSSILVPEKSRRKSRSRHAHQLDNAAGESSRNYEKPEMNAVPPRSVSLPREETEAVEVNKEFTRAASFQPDGSSPARHVHPKLPDYDDLAAKFAAMRGR